MTGAFPMHDRVQEKHTGISADPGILDSLFPFYYLILQVCLIRGFRLGLTLFSSAKL